MRRDSAEATLTSLHCTRQSKTLQSDTMPSTVGAGLALLVGCVLVLGASCEANANVTDCLSDDDCSDFPLVGECNGTSGVCSCDTYNATERIDCFYYDSSENFCRIRECWEFFNSSGRCREGSKKRLAALLLSIFLINFGAANFYIERYELAVSQIILGILLCFFQFGSCAVSAKRDDDTSKLCIFCCSINSFISLLFLAWWIADLVIFATNTRNDGDGCPLYT